MASHDGSGLGRVESTAQRLASVDPARERREKLLRLTRGGFDLVVIGGGINGAGIAREAALRGLRVALLEKGDYASGTSSKSSRLIHGGLRYLEEGDLRLVLEASRERDLLRRRLAPHLVKPLRFFFPIFAGHRVGLWKLRAGLITYDVLASFRNIGRHRAGGRRFATELEPNLRTENLRGGATYYDCFTDDARLVLETIRGAEEAGAICLNYLAVERFEKADARLSSVVARDVEGGSGALTIEGRAFVNATGPWLDRIRNLDDPEAEPMIRPTKGVHLVVDRERLGNRNALVLTAVRDGRVLFAIPWQDQTIIGTTDTDYSGDPDHVAAEQGDIGYLLETANFYFPRANLHESHVISTYAGLRPLVRGLARTLPSALSREEAIEESSSGLISLGGGKLTTYRRVAVRVVEHVVSRLAQANGRRFEGRSGTDQRPLPGADRDREIEAFSEQMAEWSDPLAPGVSIRKGEVAFAAAREMALRIEDVLRRRTSIALRRPDRGVIAARPAGRAMAQVLAWDEAKLSHAVEEYVSAAASTADLAHVERRKA